jgi:hypothetical protein
LALGVPENAGHQDFFILPATKEVTFRGSAPSVFRAVLMVGIRGAPEKLP